MKKPINVLVCIVHIALGLGLMFGSMLLGQAAAQTLGGGNQVLVYLIYSAAYAVIAILLAVLYARLTERLTCADLGITAMPGPVWLAVGLALPLGVTAFYLLAVGGTYHRVSSAVMLVLACETLPSAIAGPVEEVIFRGLMMRSIMKRWGTAAAVFLPSFVFAAVHVIMMSDVTASSYIQLLVCGTAVGVMFSLIALRGGSIWASSIVHSLWNVIMIGGLLSIHAPGSGVTNMTLYEYELSTGNVLLTGGNYGVECSLPALAGFVIISMVLALRGRRTGSVKERKN